MDSNDFWCRAFLAAMGGHYTPTDEGKVVDHGPAAAFCEEAADAALEVAQRRGMVTGEREAGTIELTKQPGLYAWTVTGGPADFLGREVLQRSKYEPLPDGSAALRIEWSEDDQPVKARIDRDIAVVIVGEREAPAPAPEPRDDGKPARVEAGQRWSMDFRDIGGAIEEYAIEAIGDELARLSGPRGVRYVTMREMLTSPRFAYIGPAAAPGPKLERPDPLPVEFTAERYGALWTLRAPELGALGIQVLSGRETYPMGSGVVRIKWDASTTPPSPVEVTVERAPKLERVEFRAERGDHGLWNLSARELGAGVSVLAGSTVTSTPDGATIRIKWGESSPPKPIEVWIERG